MTEPQPPEEPQGTDEPEDGPKIGNDGPDKPPDDDDGEV